MIGHWIAGVVPPHEAGCNVVAVVGIMVIAFAVILMMPMSLMRPTDGATSHGLWSEKPCRISGAFQKQPIIVQKVQKIEYIAGALRSATVQWSEWDTKRVLHRIESA